MTTTRVENVPAIWDDARDLPFFRMTARLFSADFCLGASVLLASYDDDTVDTFQHTAACSGTASAAVDAHSQPDRPAVPVRVRRTR
jgi:hypothetical protein